MLDLTVEIDSNGRLCDVLLEHGELRDTFAAIGRTDDALASAALLGRPPEAAVPELATLIARLLTPALDDDGMVLARRRLLEGIEGSPGCMR